MKDVLAGIARWAILLLAAFFIFQVIFSMGKLSAPELTVTIDSDSEVVFITDQQCNTLGGFGFQDEVVIRVKRQK